MIESLAIRRSVIAVALLSLVAACSSAGGNSSNSNSNAAGATVSAPPPAPAPTSTASANSGSITAVTYDTSIGAGVDANGFASLPLRSGAKQFFVNSSTGSDSNGCSGAQSASKPLATFDAAKACVTNGEGDQILIAQGTSYSAGLSNMEGKGGYSPMYPTVIESYDPADATNQAKYGLATGSNRPVLNTGGTTAQMFVLGSVAPQYIAVRGLDFNPGNIPDASIVMDATATGTVNYILFENDIFRYTTLDFDSAGSGAVRAQKFIMRNCSSYGQYSLTNGVGSQGVYIANVDGITFEDNVFWHNGWKVGASRSDAGLVGGPTIFNHPIYAQDNTRNTVARRNVFIDTSTDGGNLKGGGTYTQNLSIRNPQAAAAGGGTSYDTYAPNGVHIEIAYNAALGGGQVSTVPGVGGAIDLGYTTVNGTSDSSVHHNVLARSSTQGGSAFGVAAPLNQPSYTAFHDNISYLWSLSGHTTLFNASNYPAQVYATVASNIWDDPTSGTNINNSGTVFPNAYTESSLLTALGYSDETSFINDVINNPEKHVQRQGVQLMLTGYNVDISAMKW